MPMKIEPMPSEAMIQEEIRYCLLKAIIEAVEHVKSEKLQNLERMMDEAEGKEK